MCVNHKLVLLGLKYYDTFTTKILIYDFVSNTWKQGSDIHTARSMFACRTSSEGSIYIAGGLEKHTPSHELSEATVYNVDEDKWELLPDSHQKMGICNGVFIEGMLYVISIMGNRIQRFDPNTREWTAMVNIGFHNSWYDDVLYAFGRLFAFGRVSACRRNGIEQYDWEKNVLREFQPLPQHFLHVRATVWCDRIFLCGYNDIRRRPDFYMFNPEAALSERLIHLDEPNISMEREMPVRLISLDEPKKSMEMRFVSIATIDI
ncbi:hypothetical protein SUGI_0701690 [Cryptomeria japonica]|nr:hypothetical protein SUGI_0701690 [Cryptomeria japonica]